MQGSIVGTTMPVPAQTFQRSGKGRRGRRNRKLDPGRNEVSRVKSKRKTKNGCPTPRAFREVGRPTASSKVESSS